MKKNYVYTVFIFALIFTFLGCQGIQPKKIVLTTQESIEKTNQIILELTEKNEQLALVIQKQEELKNKRKKISLYNLEKRCEELCEQYGEPIKIINSNLSGEELNENISLVWILNNAIIIVNYINDKPISINTIPLVNKTIK